MIFAKVTIKKMFLKKLYMAKKVKYHAIYILRLLFKEQQR